MRTSRTSPYDVIIIGAGINGCTCAYFLHQAGQKVLLIDKEKIAAGGSGAAGAFIAPKISKAGPLKRIMEDAYHESLAFYNTHFPAYITNNPLLHIAKNAKDSEALAWFKENTSFLHSNKVSNLHEYAMLQSDPLIYESIVFDNSGTVDAQGVCQALAAKIDFEQMNVHLLHREEGMWRCGEYSARHVILSIGAYPKIIDVPYLSMRGIWGHRIDIKTTTPLGVTTHHHVSISATKNGICAVGATHDVHYSPFDEKIYDYESGRRELLEKVSKTYKLDNIEIVQDYAGLRSGSNDYFPLLGPLVDAQKTIAKHPRIRNGWPVDPCEYEYYPDLTLINGSGGYGFVLAPYLAHRICNHLTNAQPISEELLPERFFTRWVKKKSQS